MTNVGNKLSKRHIKNICNFLKLNYEYKKHCYEKARPCDCKVINCIFSHRVSFLFHVFHLFITVLSCVP